MTPRVISSLTADATRLYCRPKMLRPLFFPVLALSVTVVSCQLRGPVAGLAQRLPAVSAAGAAEARVSDPPTATEEPTPSTVERSVADYLASRRTSLTEDEITAVAAVVSEESSARGLEPSLVLAVMAVESEFDPFAVSSAGAMGLMQLLPSTAAELARRLDLPWDGPASLFDPVLNTRLGIAYLHELVRRFGDVEIALAAYNWGPGHVSRQLGGGGPLPVGYTRRVLERQSVHTHGRATL